MPWLGTYTVLGDMPANLSTVETQQIVAAVLQQTMGDYGYDGDSLVTLISANPGASVAQPQWPGFQLCECTVQVIFPDVVSPDSTECTLATGLAFYAAGIGFPGNVVTTLTGTSEGAAIAEPTTPAALGFAASLSARNISLATGSVQ